MNLGKAIKLCRTQKRITQSELARKANISVSYLSLLERDKRDPNFSTIESIGAALDVPLSVLIFLASDKERLRSLSSDLAEKLSFVALQLIGTDSSYGQS